MVILSVDLDKINLDDANFDKDDYSLCHSFDLT